MVGGLEKLKMEQSSSGSQLGLEINLNAGRCALRIILSEKYEGYESALKLVGLEDLESRRTRLCPNFALKVTKNVRYQHWFSKKFKHINTRSKTKFCTVMGSMQDMRNPL